MCDCQCKCKAGPTVLTGEITIDPEAFKAVMDRARKLSGPGKA